MATNINTGIVPPPVTTTTQETQQGSGQRTQEEILALIGSIETRSFRGTAGTTAGTMAEGSNDYGRANFAKLDGLNAKIEDGIKSGELNYGEARSLKAQTAALGNTIGRCLADGKIDEREQKMIDAQMARLDEQVGKLSTNAYREKAAPPPPTFQGSREDEFQRLGGLNDRIAAGVANKSLSANEQRALGYQTKAIGDLINRTLNDGKITDQEHNQLKMLMDRVNLMIDREVNDTEKGK